METNNSLMVKIHTSKSDMVSSLEDFLSSLPADTKSVQMCLYAYTDSYEDYSDKKTKCVFEADDWFNLPEEVQMELLGDAVTSALKTVGKHVSMPDDTEEDMLEKHTLNSELRLNLKSLSRSFSLYMENLDTAAVASVQLERLFEGILAYGDREVFTAAFDIFRKKTVLDSSMVDLHWKLLYAKKIKAQTAPAVKAISKEATSKVPSKEIPTEQSANGGKAIRPPEVGKPVKPDQV